MLNRRNGLLAKPYSAEVPASKKLQQPVLAVLDQHPRFAHSITTNSEVRAVLVLARSVSITFVCRESDADRSRIDSDRNMRAA